MVTKILIFIIIQLVPLFVWRNLLNRKGITVDYRLILSYFIFGSWFGMMGELFLFKIIEWIFKEPIWQYRVMPIHDGITSSFGPIMWGISAVYICFHKNYQLLKIKNKNPLVLFLSESFFLLILELIFNFVAYLIFNNYYFYYFVPDLNHWSSFTNLPFWWMGYKAIVKYSTVMYKEEKLNIAIAIIILVVLYSY
ncbi:hypothetical protein P8625_04135 [Tenacibaculum tangerinum]|uniref:Uncharacterized protein n=1 Tax=Tenacibaculum tangerinum TaxID=3038772 RepID=A0ABY8L4K8_9FLAO|nr:hypothetical protein [Tenacibaculum tangerinum]WGH76362.1 hypothetical protein P8625_04135 [Tenacibaculum tangerinum]